MRIRDLKGLGPKSEEMLGLIGVHSVDEFMQADVFELYRQLGEVMPNRSLNALYAMIGAQENKHWQEIAKERREEILIRLDDMGIAPR